MCCQRWLKEGYFGYSFNYKRSNTAETFTAGKSCTWLCHGCKIGVRILEHVTIGVESLCLSLGFSAFPNVTRVTAVLAHSLGELLLLGTEGGHVFIVEVPGFRELEERNISLDQVANRFAAPPHNHCMQKLKSCRLTKEETTVFYLIIFLLQIKCIYICFILDSLHPFHHYYLCMRVIKECFCFFCSKNTQHSGLFKSVLHASMFFLPSPARCKCLWNQIDIIKYRKKNSAKLYFVLITWWIILHFIRIFSLFLIQNLCALPLWGIKSASLHAVIIKWWIPACLLRLQFI